MRVSNKTRSGHPEVALIHWGRTKEVTAHVSKGTILRVLLALVSDASARL